MIRFSVCSHDTELEIDKIFWKGFIQKLSEKLKEEIELITYENYFEERERLKEDLYDIYYANPTIAYSLYKNGYRVVGRFKDKKDEFVLIGYKDKVELNDTVLVTDYLETYIIPLIYLNNIDFIKTSIKYAVKQKDIYEEVKNKNVDFGIVLKESYEKIEDQYKPPVVTEFKTDLSHYFMVKPELYEEFKRVIENFNNIKIIEEREFLDSYRVTFDIDSIEKIREVLVERNIYDIPFASILIYKENIVYANKHALEKLGYTFEELRNLSLTDLVADEYKGEIKNTIQRRLRGEYFPKVYENLRIKTKHGFCSYARVYTNTIFFEGEYAGFIFAIDTTKEERYKKLYSALRKINQAINNVLTEEELFKKICDILVKEINIKFVWVGVPNEEKGCFKIIYGCGKDYEYIKKTDFPVCINTSECKSPAKEAFRTGDVSVNIITDTNNTIKLWKDELLKDLRSSASIPMIRNGRVVATLNLCSSETYFFEEENKTLLEELKNELSYALEKIDAIALSRTLKSAVERSEEWVIVTDERGNILYVNQFVTKLTGYSRDELIGKNPRIFKSDYHSKGFYKRLWETVLSGKEFEAVFVNKTKDNRIIYIDAKIIPVELPNGTKRFISLGRDITRERQLTEEIERARYYDLITGFYNFNGFKFKCEDYISSHKDEILTLVIIDIVNFTYINKKYGAEISNKIIKLIGERIKRHIRNTDIVAKLGGDEFAILFTGLKDLIDAVTLEVKIKDIFEKPFEISGLEIKININAGVSVYPVDADSFVKLFENASLSLKRAKEEGTNVIRFFNKDIEGKAERVLEIENLIEKSLRDGMFTFFYQPYFRTDDRSLAGFEALVRIRDKNGKIYYPNEFVDFLEDSIYLEEFEDWALKEIVSKINRWNVPISLNISGKTFKNPDFADKVLKHTRGIRNTLTLEITERIFVEDTEFSKRVIESLKRCNNVKISMDDFGTGYSSLSYLSDLNIDVVKIDISFVRRITDDLKTRAIVEGILHIANSLNIETVAEGVETETQYEILRGYNVNYVQGYLFERPVPEEDVEKLYIKRSSKVS